MFFLCSLQGEEEEVKSDPVKDKSFADETIDNVRLQKDQVSTHSLSVFQFTKCFGKLSSRFFTNG